MRRSQIIMGTGVSVDIPNTKSEKIFDEVFDLLRSIDERFSPYRDDNELAEFRRDNSQISVDMQAIKKDCERYEKLTNGFFSASFEGVFNPTGYVKGWAIARAGQLIEKSGYKTFCVAIGGDILAKSDGSKEWAVGIQDPKDNKKILNKLSIFNGAVATSGRYERGQHIINPKTGKPATKLLSITVVGPNIIKADVLATAGFAMGIAGLEFINQQKGYEAMAIDNKNKMFLSSGMTGKL